MILLDTHIWVKWVLDESQLPSAFCELAGRGVAPQAHRSISERIKPILSGLG